MTATKPEVFTATFMCESQCIVNFKKNTQSNSKCCNAVGKYVTTSKVNTQIHVLLRAPKYTHSIRIVCVVYYLGILNLDYLYIEQQLYQQQKTK